MTLFITNKGREKPIGKKLNSTSAIPIIEGNSRTILTLESLSISCAASTTLSLWITDGTTIYYLKQGETISANTSSIISTMNIPFFDGWSLKAQAGAADRIDIIAIVSQDTQLTTPR